MFHSSCDVIIYPGFFHKHYFFDPISLNISLIKAEIIKYIFGLIFVKYQLNPTLFSTCKIEFRIAFHWFLVLV